MNGTPAYYFENKTLDIGKARNPDSILELAHIYTVGYDESIIMSHRPLVRDDFIRMVKEVLNRREVYAIYKKRINFNASIDIFPELFLNLDQWEFYYKVSNNVASKRRIINEIKNLKSYVIENAFSKLLETNWKLNYNNFFIDIKIKREITRDEIYVKYSVLEKILKFAILSMQRNPKFDFFGFFNISAFDYNLYSKEIRNLSGNGIDGAKSFCDNIKRCVHLSKLYESLFGAALGLEKHKSIFKIIDNVLKTKGFKIVIYSTKNSSFITSDNCVFLNKNNVTRQNFNMLIFPMSAYFLLTICRTTEESDINNIE